MASSGLSLWRFLKDPATATLMGVSLRHFDFGPFVSNVATAAESVDAMTTRTIPRPKAISRQQTACCSSFEMSA